MPFPTVIQGNNLSQVWLEVFNCVLGAKHHEVIPLVVSLGGFKDNGEPEELEGVRCELDKFLEHFKEQKCHTVANTIFPISLYQVAKYDRQKLFAMYKQILPRIKAAEKRLNGHGLYFERMIEGNDGHGDNQLEWVISRYRDRSKSGIRRTSHQISIFRPKDDHLPKPRMGFPCLQHVTFTPDKKHETLSLNAFYATQEVVTKAYGNYLGLCRLGAFLAKEMGLKLDTVTCYIGVEKFENEAMKISDLRVLGKTLEKLSSSRANN